MMPNLKLIQTASAPSDIYQIGCADSDISMVLCAVDLVTDVLLVVVLLYVEIYQYCFLLHIF